MESKYGIKKRIRTSALIFFMALVLVGFYPAKALGATSDLTVRAGFYGGPYYELNTFSYEDMCQLATDEPIIYSGIDTGNFVRVCYAWGVKMETLLNECNIDMDSVKYFHMSTADNYGESTTTFSSDILTERYFYPNLAREMPASGQVNSFSDEYKKGAIQVPVLLAINCSDFSRDEALRVRQEGIYRSYNPTDLSDEYRYRIIYGQKAITSSLSDGYNVQTSGKYVYAMDIQLEGSPALTIKKTLISGNEGKVGSKYILKVEATLPASYSYLSRETLQKLEEQVLDNVKVSGFDSSVIHVTGLDSDETLNGSTCQVEIVGAGETQLQFSYSRKEYGGGTTAASASTSVSGVYSEDDDNGNTDNGNTDNGNTDNGDTDNGNTDNGNTDNGSTTIDDKDSSDLGGDNLITASQDIENIIGSTDKKTATGDGDSEWVAFDPQSTVIDFSSDANNVLGATGAAAGILLIGGFCGEVFLFRKGKGRRTSTIPKKNKV